MFVDFLVFTNQLLSKGKHLFGRSNCYQVWDSEVDWTILDFFSQWEDILQILAYYRFCFALHTLYYMLHFGKIARVFRHSFSLTSRHMGQFTGLINETGKMLVEQIMQVTSVFWYWGKCVCMCVWVWAGVQNRSCAELWLSCVSGMDLR